MERIGIFCADESELAPFLRRLEREEVRQAVMLPFTLVGWRGAQWPW